MNIKAVVWKALTPEQRLKLLKAVAGYQKLKKKGA